MRKLNEKALLDQAEAFRRQAALAENAADAAHRSAVAAEESARLTAQGQRAWVTIDAVQAAHAPVYLDRGQEITGHPEQIEFSAHTTITPVMVGGNGSAAAACVETTPNSFSALSCPRA
jgi:hypothetical protein